MPCLKLFWAQSVGEVRRLQHFGLEMEILTKRWISAILCPKNGTWYQSLRMHNKVEHNYETVSKYAFLISAVGWRSFGTRISTKKRQGIINKSGIHAYTKQLISDNDHTVGRSVVGQEHYFFSFSQIMHEYFVNIAWLTKLHATKADSSIPEKVTMQISGRQK